MDQALNPTHILKQLLSLFDATIFSMNIPSVPSFGPSPDKNYIPLTLTSEATLSDRLSNFRNKNVVFTFYDLQGENNSPIKCELTGTYYEGESRRLKNTITGNEFNLIRFHGEKLKPIYFIEGDESDLLFYNFYCTSSEEDKIKHNIWIADRYGNDIKNNLKPLQPAKGLLISVKQAG